MIASAFLIVLFAQELGTLVEKLASEKVEDRQQAEDALVARGEPILAALEKFRSTAEPEVAGRIDQVAYRIRWWERVVWANGVAVDVDSGKALWALPERVLSGVACITKTDVYIWNTAKLFRHSLRERTPLWSVPTVEGSGDLYEVGGLILAVGRECVQAFSSDLGREAWPSFPIPVKDGAIPAIETADGRFLLSSRAGFVLCDSVSGQRLWKADDAPRSSFLPGGDVVLTGSKTTRRCRGTDGQILWSVDRPGEILFPAAGHILTGAEAKGTSGTTFVLDPKTGEERWNVSDLPAATALSADGKHLYWVSRRLGEDNHREVLVVDVARWTVSRKFMIQWSGGIFRVEGDRILVVDYRRSCCGLGLRSYSAADGKHLWTGETRGIPTEHSKYFHQVRMELRGNRIILVGFASAGDYVETFRKETGALLSRWSNR